VLSSFLHVLPTHQKYPPKEPAGCCGNEMVSFFCQQRSSRCDSSELQLAFSPSKPESHRCGPMHMTSASPIREGKRENICHVSSTRLLSIRLREIFYPLPPHTLYSFSLIDIKRTVMTRPGRTHTHADASSLKKKQEKKVTLTYI